jgi:hypothetical protein
MDASGVAERERRARQVLPASGQGIVGPPQLTASQASRTSTMSPISQSRLVTLVAIDGVCVAHSHPDHHSAAREHAIGALRAPAPVDSRAAIIGLLDRRGGGRRSVVCYRGQPERPGSELADRTTAVLPP